MNNKLNRYIYLNEHSLSHELCKEIIDMFNKEPNKLPGRTVGGINPNTKNTIDYSIQHTAIHWKKIRECVIDELLYNVEVYINNLNTEAYNKQPVKYNEIDTSDTTEYINFKELNINNLFFEVLNVQIYKANSGRYVFHNDGLFEPEQKCFRVITYLWYLNDVEEGGETLIWDNLKIKPTAGKLLLFPSTWTFPHTGLMPISNDKYILTGWVYQHV
jgi:Rps23 Pro-64 3,4-dihydroxylase Tpa1-like proline 4-hydroxylase